MNLRSILLTTVVALGTNFIALPPARATSNYQFKPGEFITIYHGKSPDKQYSLAAHGEGELGVDNFNIYLMDKSGKKIGPLEEITKDSYQDTDPKAYEAQWSADSSEVGITYRADHSTIVTIRYRIKNGRATKLSGPSKASKWPHENK